MIWNYQKLYICTRHSQCAGCFFNIYQKNENSQTYIYHSIYNNILIPK
jgi:hypothetical protein